MAMRDDLFEELTPLLHSDFRVHNRATKAALGWRKSIKKMPENDFLLTSIWVSTSNFYRTVPQIKMLLRHNTKRAAVRCARRRIKKLQKMRRHTRRAAVRCARRRLVNKLLNTTTSGKHLTNTLRLQFPYCSITCKNGVIMCRTEDQRDSERCGSERYNMHICVRGKNLHIIFPVHAKYNESLNIHRDGTTDYMSYFARAVKKAFPAFKQVTCVFAGDFNNSQIAHKTESAADGQGNVTGLIAVSANNWNTWFESTSTFQVFHQRLIHPFVSNVHYKREKAESIINQYVQTDDGGDDVEYWLLIDALSDWLSDETCAVSDEGLGDHPCSVVRLPSGLLVAIHCMLGYGENGFNLYPLFGFFCHRQLPELLKKHGFKAEDASLIVEKVIQNVHEKVCSHYNLTPDVATGMHYKTAEHQDKLRPLLLKQKRKFEAFVREAVALMRA